MSQKKPLYNFADSKNSESYAEELGDPGSFPYTRGPYPGMYTKRPWTMRQYAGFGSALESNKRYRYLLERGTTGLSVAFDLPTQMGLDSDDPRAEGEVGKVGVAIDSIEDMRILFDEIDLSKVSTSMTINSTASILLALYVAVAKERGSDPKLLKGTIQNDLLKEYIARGTYIYPPEESLRIITDIFSWCTKEMPNWNTISISGYHIREAGSTAVQELAFTIYDGLTYIETAIKAGLDVNEFTPRLSFFFNVHNDFLEEIAKFRAARRIWARLLKERFKVTNEKGLRLRFHAQTAGSTLTAQQPRNNLMRVTLQAMAAVLGGTQSLHTNSWDEALQLPTEQSAKLALRTQQIIASETGVTESADPLGGSYLIENLTDELEADSMKLIERLDEMGGMVAAIQKGWVQKQIMHSAYLAQKSIDSKEQIIVGVNEYLEDSDCSDSEDVSAIDNAELEKDKNKRLKAFRKSRDQANTDKALSDLKAAAQSDTNLMPLILNACEKNATLGEIAGTLKDVFGAYREPGVF